MWDSEQVAYYPLKPHTYLSVREVFVGTCSKVYHNIGKPLTSFNLDAVAVVLSLVSLVQSHLDWTWFLDICTLSPGSLSRGM